jgi:type IV pilus modification protein PilV
MKNNNWKLHSQSGVGLIEVMVAIILLAMGLLGAVALQFATAKEQRSSQFVARAALLGNEMAERMRSNRAGVEAGLYNMQTSSSHTYNASNQTIANNTFDPYDCSPVPDCINPTWVADRDIVNWGQLAFASLPQPAAILLPVPNTANARDIVLAWVEPVVDKRDDGTLVQISQQAGNNGCPALISAPVGVRCYQMRFVL